VGLEMVDTSGREGGRARSEESNVADTDRTVCQTEAGLG